MALHVVILAAGRGERMCSTRPKVLHTLAGKPLLMRVVETALHLNPDKIHIVIGHGSELVQKTLAASVDDNDRIHWVSQTEQLGTGHALLQALPAIPTHAHVLVLSGDVPLIQADTLQSLIDHATVHTQPVLALLVASLPDPTGLGRILRDSNNAIYQIMEEKDATVAQRHINEIYSGICYAHANDLNRWLPTLTANNAQKELYLTAIIGMASHEGIPIISLDAAAFEIQGVNTREQLQHLERLWQERLASALMRKGVTIADAKRIDIRGDLTCGMDVFIDVNAVFEGHVVLGPGCHIGPHCTLKDVTLGANTHVMANSVLEGCYTEADCHIGPFARIRPGTHLSSHCKIGNFVETKNATLGAGSKANHLSYLGDATLGQHVNIGAGTITCNYDGVNKYKTIIEDGVLIGSDTQLIAPVTVGANATIGAGSTIRKDVPAGELTFTESTQQTIYGWRRKEKTPS